MIDGPDLSDYIVVIREDEEVTGEDRVARRALNHAENQTEANVDVRAVVLGCQCCKKRTNCLLYTHSLDLATSIVKE